MAFGKPGRPPEDRLARQQEIFLAVTPLLYQEGARRLSMRAAARAACVSVGGLCHYFPTKRALVLHGLDWEARTRLCEAQKAQLAECEELTFAAYLDVYLEHAVRMFSFMRPSLLAAPELGQEDFQSVLDAGLTLHVEELVETLRMLLPGLPDSELTALGRAARRIAIGALVDRHVEMSEVRGQLRALIVGYAALADAPSMVMREG